MAKYFSASAQGFFDDGVHASMPPDAVKITDDHYQALLLGQAQGQIIAIDGRGKPVNQPVHRPKLSDQREAAIANVRRQAEVRILAIAPMWRQLNDTRAMFYGGDGDFDAARARFAAIDAVRAASSTLEAAIATMSTTDLAALDVTADAHWPTAGASS